MARSNLLRLRNAWLQVHKWIGLSLALLIIPLSLSGSALVWHEALDQALNPKRYAVTEGPALPVAAWEAAARKTLAPGERLVSIRWPEHEGAVVATATPPPADQARPGPPVRTNIWIDPATGRLLDRAAANAGFARFLHGLHGSLQIPGYGRAIVGWIGVFMLLSSLTGLWLWWPLRGRWTRGLRWNRQPAISANLHHQLGFWIAIPLAMLSLTGAWISFPAFFGPLAGEVRNPAGDRARAMRARPIEATRLSADLALAAARPLAGDGEPLAIAWPTDLAPSWKIQFARQGGPAEVEVADATGDARPPKPPRPETLSRTMRRWHDGTGMGTVWQLVIFVGGIFPAVLAVTGIMMWLRTRGWRGELKSRQAAAEARAG
jgi:uncharacterized iron-regulated membrane protein